MAHHILAVDQGTTGTTALIFDAGFNILAKETVDFPQHFPKPAWVEHDLEEIWGSVEEAVRRALRSAQLDGKTLAAIGITNQRETTCLWRREGAGVPLGRAIVWQDRRTASDCEALKRRGLEPVIRRKTGLVLDPYFSATKLKWMLKHSPGAMALAKKGALAFGTIDSFLLYRMTGRHGTDVSNASRTMLMNLKTLKWDDDLLKLFGIPKTILPEILPSATLFGHTRSFCGLPDGIPVAGIAGDQQAALFGQACFKPGTVKCTYGTGAFILVNTGDKPVLSRHRLLTTVGWQYKGKTTYCLEGSAFIAGAAVQWLRDGLGILEKSSEVEALATSVADNGGVAFVPALSGLGAPHWWSDARGVLSGLTRGTTRAHVARATLEGIAFQVGELLEAIGKDMGRRPRPIKVDGGAAANNFLMQFQADLMGVDVVRSAILETTALGAGTLAGLQVGLWADTQEVERRWLADATFRPQWNATHRKGQWGHWNRAVAAVRVLRPGIT